MKDYLSVSFYKPASTYKNLFADKNKIALSSLLLFLLGILYTITVFVGYKNGFGAVVKPVINIPAEEYYFYEIFFCIPLFFLIAIIFAGTSRFLSIIFKGNGTFENNFVIYCTASIIPTLLTMWLPETTLMIFFPHYRAEPLGGFRILPGWVDALRQIIGVIWPMVISIIGIKVSENINIIKSIVVTIISFIVCAIIMLIFIR